MAVKMSGIRACVVCKVWLPERHGPGRKRLYCSRSCEYTQYQRRKGGLVPKARVQVSYFAPIKLPVRRLYAADDGELVLKRCGRCNEYAPVERYAKDRSRSDGYNNSCKSCSRRGASAPMENAYGKRTLEEIGLDQARLRPRGIKRCLRNHDAPLESFHADKSRPDGLSSTCRDCYRNDNPLTERTCSVCGVMFHAKRHNNERVCSNACAERQRAVYDKARASKLRNRTRDEIAADQARLRPDGLKRCRRDHYAPLSSFSSDVSRADGLNSLCRDHDTKGLVEVALNCWEDLDLWACVYCGGEFEDVEHSIPRSRADEFGMVNPDHADNLRPSCRDCNRGPGGKHARTAAEWRPHEHAAMREAVRQARRRVTRVK